MRKRFFLKMEVVSSFILFIAVLAVSVSFAQEKITNTEETTISGGAEYSRYIQEMIRSGESRMLENRGNIGIEARPTMLDAITTYDGITFDEDASNSGYYHIPPDPIGVAGPSHLVSIVNTSIEWFTKAGVQQNSQRLGKNSSTAVGSFFASLSPTTGTFDPKVIYDQYAGRFVVVTLEVVGDTDDEPGNISRILLAVSDDSDPNGTWYYHAIDSKLTISSHDSWADYPGFAVDEEAVYVCANMFRFSGGSSLDSRTWIIAKSPFYSGGSAVVNVYVHGTLASIGTVPTTQPTHMFGTPSDATLGTFLISSQWTAGSTDYLSVIKITNPLTSPTFANTFVNLGDAHDGTLFTDAPQLGTDTLIETNDMRALHAVWRNDTLWVVNCVVPPTGSDAGQVTAHWYKIQTSSGITLSEQGDIGGESIASGCYTFFPSIAVNSSNDIVVGFAASAPTIYPGCYYTGRLSSDAAGYTIPPDVLRAGLDYYRRTFGEPRNRWGDYSGTSVDPSDDQTFYVFNQYALERGTLYIGEDGRWGTAFGVVPVSALPVELVDISVETGDQSATLKWRTATETKNFGFEIERRLTSPVPPPYQGGDNRGGWLKVGFVAGSGTSSSQRDYSFTDRALSPGRYSYRLKQIDNDGFFKYSQSVEVEISTPKIFTLMQNYPNPFNPVTTIEFTMETYGHTSLRVYDLLGREVAVLVDEELPAGILHKATFDGSELSSGIYIYRLQSGNNVQVKKLILMK